MTTQHQCPLCASPLWPHVRGGQMGWFCRHCEQEVPYSVDNNEIETVTAGQGHHPHYPQKGWVNQTMTGNSEQGVFNSPIQNPFTLRDLLHTAVTGISQFLQTDRVIIAQRMDSGGMTVVEEWRKRPWKTLQHAKLGQFLTFADLHTWEQGNIEVVGNVHQNSPKPASMMTFDSLFEVKAKVIVPILQNRATLTPFDPTYPKPNRRYPSTAQSLWGLLIVHQCSDFRQWTESEIGLLSLLATQIAISIQQDSFYQHLNTINQKLETIAFQDKLTQVANRHYFEQYFDEEWRRMAREKKPLSLILCDVDFFKPYNDTYGHPEGDSCLQEIANVLKYTLHRPGDLVARYGGEEFVVLLPNTEASGAVHLAEQIRTAVKGLKIPAASLNVSDYVTLSLGVSCVIPRLEMSTKLLLNQADQALYKAKDQGRDRIVLYHPKETFWTTSSDFMQPVVKLAEKNEPSSPTDLLKSYVAYFVSRGIKINSPTEGILPFDGLVYQYEGYHQDFLNVWHKFEQRSDYQQLSLQGDTYAFGNFLTGNYQVNECARCNLPLVTTTGNIYDLPSCTLCLEKPSSDQINKIDYRDNSSALLKVLVITKDSQNRQRLKLWLNKNQIDVQFLHEPKSISSLMLSESITAVIIDSDIDENTAKNWAKYLHQQPKLEGVPIIALSDQVGEGIPWVSRKLQVEDYLLTPLNGHNLADYLRYLSQVRPSCKSTEIYWFPR
ncbi:diguanylate cyclase [Crocosphaera sp. UHCC 0190]|uniref:sensor domain-containing diguanylate cyclase n=1 Tax=Crocosphaera sp. UHCC 0190 TaxID=3110246 RepID=UPI002B1F7069|nr:diguanylate cyclase [Crocosphaera sp. UHCC 0190]MEA5511700.1 diguanylate cyclase [Crocosphaera sp. UHCC 0190]